MNRNESMTARNREIPQVNGAPTPLRDTSSPPQGPDVVEGGATRERSVDRRTFFRVFGRQTLSMVADVADVAASLSRGPATLAAMAGRVPGEPASGAERSALTLGAEAEPARGTAASASPVGPSAWIPGDVTGTMLAGALNPFAHRNPFRLVGDELHVLDQRVLPDRLEEVVCRNAADVAFHMRALTVRGGPLLAQLAACGIALTARDVEDLRWRDRRAELRRAKRALLLARPSVRMVHPILERLEATWLRFGADIHGSMTADVLRQEAEVLAMATALDQATIARALADLLASHADAAARSRERRGLSLLVHGDPGALSTGTVGAVMAALRVLADEGRHVRVWLTETRPHFEGLRLAAWELRLAGIEHMIVTDSAAAWLLEHEPVDAVLLGADWIASNGDAANVVGSRTVAELASLGLRDGRRVPVYICAPIGTIDLRTRGGRAIPRENRAGLELSTYLAGLRVPPQHLVNPAVDVVPADRIHAFVTEEGVLRPPYPASLAAGVAASEAKVPPLPTPPLQQDPSRAPRRGDTRGADAGR